MKSKKYSIKIELADDLTSSVDACDDTEALKKTKKMLNALDKLFPGTQDNISCIEIKPKI